MSTGFKGHVELDAKILLRVKDFQYSGGRAKKKIIPPGAEVAVDSSHGPRTVTGSMVIYGTKEDGYEFDWRAACNGTDKYEVVRHYDSSNRILFREFEFSTFEGNLPDGEDEADITLQWLATEDVNA